LDAKSAVVRVHLAEMLLAEGNKVEAAGLLKNLDEKMLDKEGGARLSKLKGQL
jgi:hypothetical protein